MVGTLEFITAAVLLTISASEEDAAERFRDLDFVSKVAAGHTLLVTGSETLFDHVFDTILIYTPRDVRALDRKAARLMNGLPPDKLTDSLSGIVAKIGFESPTDSGPVSIDNTEVQEDRNMHIVSAALITKPDIAAEDVATRFTALGFDVQTIGSDTVLLTGALSLFEQTLAIPLNMESGGVSAAGGEPGSNVNLSSLPTPMVEGVAQMSFETPPDFGPKDY